LAAQQLSQRHGEDDVSTGHSSKVTWQHRAISPERCTIFNPRYEEFEPRTMWSLSNAFASALKELEPIPQCKETAKLGSFLSEIGA
jgi:hypothetical protein